MSDTVIRTHADPIWRVADKLRGVYKQSEYGRVILPLTVLRRLDCVLGPTKEAVLAKHDELRGRIENVERTLRGFGRAVLLHLQARVLPPCSVTAARRPLPPRRHRRLQFRVVSKRT